MKKILLPILSIALFAACNNKKDDAIVRQIVLTDTVQLHPSGINTDIAQEVAPAPAVRPQVVYVDRYVQAPAPRRAPRPASVPVVPQPEPVATPAPAPAPAPEVAIAPLPTSIPDVPVEVEKKKGMSDAAKGAVIGGVGGAVAGAVLGKNTKGAILGGVIGAAGGYIIGKGKDKKSGRIDIASNR